MKFLGKGKALRPGWSGAMGAAPIGAAPIGGMPAEEVYLAPGMPQGVSTAELMALSVPLQMWVMGAWFRANHKPAPPASTRRTLDPQQALIGEFGSRLDESIAALAQALRAEAPAWVEVDDLEQIVAKARIGIVIASADPRVHRLSATQASILARLEAVEAALAELKPPHGGLGHNNPPDGPLTSEEHAEASAAVAELKEEVSARQPDTSRVQRAVHALSNTISKLGGWLLRRFQKAAQTIAEEEVEQLARTAIRRITGHADVQAAYERLTDVVEAVQRWIQLLGG